jgi:hypothetical protein
MPTYEAAFLLFAAGGIAWVLSLLLPAVRGYLLHRGAWAAIAIGAAISSAASWFITEERMGGTLLQRLHGWPKPFSWECLSVECTSPGPSFVLRFFIGNSFAYAAGLLMLWVLTALLLVLLGRRSGSPRP